MLYITILWLKIHFDVKIHIQGNFGGDFNLAVRQFWLRSLNLMYANTTWNHVYYEASWSNVHSISPDSISPYTFKLKYPPMCIMSQFTKLIVGQIYHVFSSMSFPVQKRHCINQLWWHNLNTKPEWWFHNCVNHL